MKKFVLISLFVFWTHASFAEVVDLNCKLGDRKFYAGLDFENSKWLNEDGSSTYMTYNEDVIGTVKPQSKMDITHTLWILSRKTGVGEIAGYILTEEELDLISDKQLEDILLKEIGDLENKSLDSARNKSFAQTIVEYLLNRPNKKVAGYEVPPITTEFECEKSEKKYKF